MRLDRRAGGGLDSLPVDPIIKNKKNRVQELGGLRNTGGKRALSELNRNLLDQILLDKSCVPRSRKQL